LPGPLPQAANIMHSATSSEKTAIGRRNRCGECTTFYLL